MTTPFSSRRRVGDEVIKGINLYGHAPLFKIPFYTISPDSYREKRSKGVLEMPLIPETCLAGSSRAWNEPVLFLYSPAYRLGHKFIDKRNLMGTSG